MQSPSVLRNRHGLWGARPTVLDSPGSDRSGARCFQPSACQKGSKDVPIKHENHRRAQMHSHRPGGAHCMLARRDRPIRRAGSGSSSNPIHPSIRPAEQSRAEQSTTIGWCEVPAWCLGARGARVWYGVKASQAQLRRPVTPPGPPRAGTRAPTTTRAAGGRERPNKGADARRARALALARLDHTAR